MNGIFVGCMFFGGIWAIIGVFASIIAFVNLWFECTGALRTFWWSKKQIVGIIILILLVCVGPPMLTGVILCNSFESNDIVEVSTYDIWYFSGPFGEFYADGEGKWEAGLLGSGPGEFSTTPSESYVIKYLDGNQLITLAIDATDRDNKVFLVDNNTVSTISIYESYEQCDGVGGPWIGQRYKTRYIIEIPDPKFYEEVST